ncbi:dynamin family protein [Clostridium thermobutyricum]|uniref:dynamin family protein n=1 Tax=Clostridium thermobutyricum TaxID=29372 RepID=UPI002943A8CE|nr:dynamin family protein [Clostridium thermobutyricum]
MKKDIKIAVVATMSSGKSTLINALLGQELLPSKNEACTAKISKIANNNMLKEFQCECLDKNRNVIYKEKSVSYEDLEKYNEDEKVVYLNIEGPIDYIFDGENRLILIDTPGPNNSRDIRHGEITDKILNDKDFEKIIYVMNATQFGINDDSNFLRKISHLMRKENEKLKDKFLFVVNKCDELDIEKEETLDKLLEMVKEYLLNFEIKNPNIIFTSAQMAKLIRIDKLGKKLSRKEKAFLKSYEDFIEIEGFHFEKFATVDENIKEKIKDKLKKAKIDKDECEEVLIHTGIPVLEAYINEYLSECSKKEINIINKQRNIKKLKSNKAKKEEKQ